MFGNETSSFWTCDTVMFPSGVVVVLEASALQFNAQHNVDFNTWIRDGIPYMSREDRKGKKPPRHLS